MLQVTHETLFDIYTQPRFYSHVICCIWIVCAVTVI